MTTGEFRDILHDRARMPWTSQQIMWFPRSGVDLKRLALEDFTPTFSPSLQLAANCSGKPHHLLKFATICLFLSHIPSEMQVMCQSQGKF